MEVQDRKPKKKPTKVEEMTKEQIRQAIVKKRECNAKAQNIVESLIEKDITESYFLSCLPDINQSHLDDVIEERAIIHLCGYPVCPKTISERDIPKQKYRISVKTNKVYDITTRKNFCSNSCYKAAMYVKKQLLTSPLWFREYEEIPKFHLLQSDSGSLGQEIDLSLTERLSIKSKEKFTSINDFTNASLHEMTGNEYESEKETDVEHNKELQDTKPTENTKIDIEINNIDKNKNTTKSKDLQQPEYITNASKKGVSETTANTTDKSKNPQTTSNPNPTNIVGEIVEKPERRIDPILTNTPDKTSKIVDSSIKKPQKKQPSITLVTIEVEKCLAEWFTVDTLLFIFGEEKVKEMVEDKGECIKEYLNKYAQSIFYSSNSYDQYQALCRKLNMLEIEDRRYDSQALQRETKPLPDYTILQEESKRLELKVKAFYAADTVVPEVNSIEKKTSTDDDSSLTNLPLVDKNAQNALRRRIVCGHLNKVLPDLLRSLGLLTLTISSDVRLIVNTFKLKPNNVMFKPIQWTLIAIIIIKLLSLRDRRLGYLLEQPTTYQHMQLLLLSYKQDGGYLDRLISWLTDIDRLLDTNDTQLTIE